MKTVPDSPSRTPLTAHPRTTLILLRPYLISSASPGDLVRIVIRGGVTLRHDLVGLPLKGFLEERVSQTIRQDSQYVRDRQHWNDRLKSKSACTGTQSVPKTVKATRSAAATAPTPTTISSTTRFVVPISIILSQSQTA